LARGITPLVIFQGDLYQGSRETTTVFGIQAETAHEAAGGDETDHDFQALTEGLGRLYLHGGLIHIGLDHMGGGQAALGHLFKYMAGHGQAGPAHTGLLAHHQVPTGIDHPAGPSGDRILELQQKVAVIQLVDIFGFTVFDQLHFLRLLGNKVRNRASLFQ
jgi:hypothetical protein